MKLQRMAGTLLVTGLEAINIILANNLSLFCLFLRSDLKINKKLID